MHTCINVRIIRNSFHFIHSLLFRVIITFRKYNRIQISTQTKTEFPPTKQLTASSKGSTRSWIYADAIHFINIYVYSIQLRLDYLVS